MHVLSHSVAALRRAIDSPTRWQSFVTRDTPPCDPGFRNFPLVSLSIKATAFATWPTYDTLWKCQWARAFGAIAWCRWPFNLRPQSMFLAAPTTLQFASFRFDPIRILPRTLARTIQTFIAARLCFLKCLPACTADTLIAFRFLVCPYLILTGFAPPRRRHLGISTQARVVEFRKDPIAIFRSESLASCFRARTALVIMAICGFPVQRKTRDRLQLPTTAAPLFRSIAQGWIRRAPVSIHLSNVIGASSASVNTLCCPGPSVPYLYCISTTFKSLPPALHVALPILGVTRPSMRSLINADIRFAKSCPVLTPLAAIFRLRGCATAGVSDFLRGMKSTHPFRMMKLAIQAMDLAHCIA